MDKDLKISSIDGRLSSASARTLTGFTETEDATEAETEAGAEDATEAGADGMGLSEGIRLMGA